MHQVLGDSFRPEPPIGQGFEQRRNLRRKYDARISTGFRLTDRVVQRLDTKAITNQPCRTTFLIPQRHREHSSQSTKGLESFVLIQMDQDFGIAATLESMSSAHKLLTQFSIVIDLSVHDGPNRTPLIADWLLSPDRINHPKSPNAKHNSRLTIGSLFVRASMDQTPQHRLECRTVILSYDSTNAAHSPTSPFQARYGHGVPILLAPVHGGEKPTEVEHPLARTACAWRFRPTRVVFAHRAPPLRPRGKERESFPTRARCASKTDGMWDLDSSPISWLLSDNFKRRSA